MVKAILKLGEPDQKAIAQAAEKAHQEAAVLDTGDRQDLSQLVCCPGGAPGRQARRRHHELSQGHRHLMTAVAAQRLDIAKSGFSLLTTSWW